MVERYNREGALARLKQLGAEFSEENSTEKRKLYFSGSTGYWVEVSSTSGGGFQLDFFQECPCTRSDK